MTPCYNDIKEMMMMPSIPITFDMLISNRVIESFRIDYKKDWNPEAVTHTICAFANDMDNQGGGYVVIGIEEEDGMPKLPLSGLDRNRTDSITKDIINKCNLIEPRYIPIIENITYKEKDFIVLWCPGGADRPYKCPSFITKDKSRKPEMIHYIRKGSSTIRANTQDEKRLFELSEDVPFDDRINYNAQVEDIKNDLVKDFLYSVDSKLYDRFRNIEGEDVLESMHLIAGPVEMRKPLNIALMFFNDHPEDFFPYAYIEIVTKPDPTGTDMEEMVFKGPLHIQLKNALRHIGNMVIKEKVEKLPDRAEALRCFNYPYQAVEEALSNAVFHKSYQIREPITVTITNSGIEIKSNPGPDGSISDEDLLAGILISSHYRNRRIGDYLKELGLAEARNTGVPTMIHAMEKNGSPRPLFKTDPVRSAFRVILPIHPAFIESEKKAEVLNAPRRKKGSVKSGILDILATYGASSSTEIAKHFGYDRTTGSLLSAIRELLEEEKIEYMGDKPTTRGQKLRVKV